MNMRSVIGVTILVVGVVACGGASAPEQATPVQAPSAQARVPADDRAAGATLGAPTLHIEDLKACEIVTPQEASTIIGGKLLNEPPVGFSNCAYVVDVDGTTESYRISFSAPAMYAAMLETQSATERGEPVAGLWDEAYVHPRAPDSGYSLVAVQRGRLAIEVWGDRKEPLIKLAQLAVSRVP
jgi:hypothetical protein